jgi:tetratricopeptide (TPR) repeat protein
MDREVSSRWLFRLVGVPVRLARFLMFGWVGACLRFLRRRWLFALGALFLVGGAVVAGGHLWAMSEWEKAQAALDEARFDDARGHLLGCMRLWPWSTSTCLVAARLERLALNFPAAAARIKRCQQLQGGPAEATQAEWLCLRLEGGELDQLEPGLWKAVQARGPFTTLYLEALARASFRAHRLSKVRRYVNLWLENDPNSVRALMSSAAIHELQFAPTHAAAAYQKVLQLRPQHRRARLQLANLYLSLKQPEEAELHLQQLQREQGGQHEVDVALAYLYVLQGKDQEATALLDRLLQQDPADAEALVLRGQLECEAGRPARGERLLEEAVKLRPKNPAALWQYYSCLQQQGGRVEEARAIYKRHQALTQATNRLTQLLREELEMRLTDPDLLAEAGLLFAEIGHEQEGVEFFYRALHNDPGCVKAHRALMEHFTRTGDKERAAQHRDELSRLERQATPP